MLLNGTYLILFRAISCYFMLFDAVYAIPCYFVSSHLSSRPSVHGLFWYFILVYACDYLLYRSSGAV